MTQSSWGKVKTVDAEKIWRRQTRNCSGKFRHAFHPSPTCRSGLDNKKGCISRCSLKKMEAQDMKILRFL
jgi:hypothetical protein